MVSISYIGEEAFDIVLYMARTMTKLNYRVLIIDLSDSTALYKSIYHGMDLDSRETIVNYRDINYTRKAPSNEELEPFSTGVVFVVYGYSNNMNFQLPFLETNVVINTFPHVIERVNSMMMDMEGTGFNHRLLIRDILSIDDLERVKSELSFTYEDDKNDYLYLDLDDRESAVNCQVKQIVNFANVSGRMESYITGHLHVIFPQINMSYIKKAFKEARKGR